MNMRQANLQIVAAEGVKQYVLTPGRANSFDELYVDFHCAEMHNGKQYTVFLHPKTDLVVQRLEIQFDMPGATPNPFMANGYQSWSESRLLQVGAFVPALRRIARPFMGYYGDAHLDGVPIGGKLLHSWTYTYLRANPGETVFLGSLNERTGFTLFLFDRTTGVLTVRKDLGGLALSHSFPALDVWIGQGRESDMFDAYFALLAEQNTGLSLNRPVAPAAGLGWTSWYRYFTSITEDIIWQNTQAIASSGLPFRYVQIDDGWQTAVGDWRSVKPEFPGGMGRLAADIRDKGLTPGLWLAPFVAASGSDLIRRHPDWLLKGRNGRPLRAGWNPLWGGWYYALDFYHPGVQEYLSGVFHIVLDQWGYQLLKLDFLFAVCLAPPAGKTRGQVMFEAMEFLRRQVGGREMLACGVPLGSVFGLADYCRVSGDIHLSWEHWLLRLLRHRERVSTLAALRSTLSRWQLNGRAFCSDPDVFILRNSGQRLTPAQQNTLLTINALLGGVLFTSDDVSGYSPEQLAELEEALGWQGSVVQLVTEEAPDLYRIDFKHEDQKFAAYCNLTKNTCRLSTAQRGQLDLRPFESIILSSH